MTRPILPALVSLLAVLATPLAAATIEVVDPRRIPYEERLSGRCSLRLSGPIVAGDAERLRQTLEPMKDALHEDAQYGIGFNLCLNSEGGSFAEGLALARTISGLVTATVVKSGDRCLSACAIAFFGGTIFYDGAFKMRMAAPGAVIGVHAPSLDLGPERRELPREVLTQAYLGAIADIRDLADSMLSDETVDPGMPTSLFVRMVSTPPDEMFLIETAGHFLDWDILLVDGSPNVLLSHELLYRACVNLVNTIEHGDHYSEFAEFHDMNLPNPPRPRGNLGERIRDSRAEPGEEVWEIAEQSIGGRPTGCRFFVQAGQRTFASAKPRAAVYWSNLDREQMFHNLDPLFAFPPETRIVDAVRPAKLK